VFIECATNVACLPLRLNGTRIARLRPRTGTRTRNKLCWFSNCLVKWHSV